MSLRKAAAIARAAAKSQLSSDEDEGSDGGESSKLKSNSRARTRGRTSGDGSRRRKKDRPRARSVGPSGTRPESPQPTPKARKSLDSPQKVKGTKRPQPSTHSGLNSDLSELSSLEDPDSPTRNKAPQKPRLIPGRRDDPSPTSVQNTKPKPPPSSLSSRSLFSSASFTLGVPPKTPADTSRVRNILSGVLGSGKSVLARTNSSPNIPVHPSPNSFPREAWDRGKLGSCVWVLIDRSGRFVQRRGKEDAYWWPAEVMSFIVNEISSLTEGSM